nr:MAG TPA: hypothetical protein [Caudoviricetes sp.]
MLIFAVLICKEFAIYFTCPREYVKVLYTLPHAP